MQLEYEESQIAYTLWWARLMALTGLDYKDAIIYARNRQDYERPVRLDANPDLPLQYKIVIKRSKPPRNVCEIPLQSEIEYLFNQYSNGPHAPCLADLNDWLLHIEKEIKFPYRLTSKILRKTAGFYFLVLGYRIEAVSKILGHSSVRTTERHYVKVTTSFMDNEIERVTRLGIGQAAAALQQATVLTLRAAHERDN